MKNRFRSISNKVSNWAGSPYVFVGAILIITLWALSGPSANYSDTWQLVINTGTTIITFLMVFLIQNTQNRDAKAMQLKLDELIKSNARARDVFVGLEDISDEELLEIANEFKLLHENSTPTPAILKLRQRIEAEHAKRLTFKNISGKVLTSMFSPLHVEQKTNKES